MDLYLPNSFKRQTMYGFLDEIIDSELNPKSDHFTFNFSNLRFIEPSGVTVLSNITEWLLKRNVKLSYSYPENLIKYDAIRFLDDSQFFKHYIKKTLRQFASPRTTTIPLQIVSYDSSYHWFDKTIFWLSNALNVSVGSLANIKICFQEIFNNIKDHSTENIGCAFIQHYPKKSRVKIAISDFGVGIPYNIKQQIPGISDSEAIHIATEQGFSTKSTPQNRGAGLDTLIHNVVNNNQGDVYIHSNYGILNCNHTDNQVVKSFSENAGFYPGTLIEIILRTDNLDGILDSEEDFEWDF